MRASCELTETGLRSVAVAWDGTALGCMQLSDALVARADALGDMPVHESGPEWVDALRSSGLRERSLGMPQ